MYIKLFENFSNKLSDDDKEKLFLKILHINDLEIKFNFRYNNSLVYTHNNEIILYRPCGNNNRHIIYINYNGYNKITDKYMQNLDIEDYASNLHNADTDVTITYFINKYLNKDFKISNMFKISNINKDWSNLHKKIGCNEII